MTVHMHESMTLHTQTHSSPKSKMEVEGKEHTNLAHKDDELSEGTSTSRHSTDSLEARGYIETCVHGI